MTDEESFFGMICIPVAKMPEPPVPSDLALCERCGDAIWASKATLADMAEQQKQVSKFCTDCFFIFLLANIVDDVQEPGEHTKQALADYDKRRLN